VESSTSIGGTQDGAISIQNGISSQSTTVGGSLPLKCVNVYISDNNQIFSYCDWFILILNWLLFLRHTVMELESEVLENVMELFQNFLA
jgi:hypothetical protein